MSISVNGFSVGGPLAQFAASPLQIDNGAQNATFSVDGSGNLQVDLTGSLLTLPEQLAISVNSTLALQVGATALAVDTTNKRVAVGVAVPLSSLDVANGDVTIRNGTTPVRLDLYSTRTDGSNYERLSLFGQSGDDFVLASEAAGTGTRRDLEIRNMRRTYHSWASDNSQPPALLFDKSRGSIASPADVQVDDQALSLVGRCFINAGQQPITQIIHKVASVTGGTTIGGKIDLRTADSSGTLRDALILHESQDVEIAGGYLAVPGNKATDTAPNDDTTSKKVSIQRLSAAPTNAAYIKFSNSPGTPTNDFYLVLEEN